MLPSQNDFLFNAIGGTPDKLTFASTMVASFVYFKSCSMYKTAILWLLACNL